MGKARRISILTIVLLLGACDEHDQRPVSVRGETPAEVASSIAALQHSLPPAKEAVFAQAVTTLTLVVPDKKDARSAGDMTPQFAAMVKGRSVDEIIQIANLYRLSVPMDRP
ncbi:hypothetical protein BH10PSE13_BH10PSE13_24890 [soil metagenome]